MGTACIPSTKSFPSFIFFWPDRKKLLYATYTSKQVGGQLYAVATINDFDERTGKVTGGTHLIDPTGNATYYSVEFSENSTEFLTNNFPSFFNKCSITG